jgi:hypothetical protein
MLLIGLLVATPAIALWSHRNHHTLISKPERQSVAFAQPIATAEPIVRVPVEVIANGSAPKWVYVQVGAQAVPEPGMMSLLALTAALLAFRRQRD